MVGVAVPDRAAIAVFGPTITATCAAQVRRRRPATDRTCLRPAKFDRDVVARREPGFLQAARNAIPGKKLIAAVVASRKTITGTGSPLRPSAARGHSPAAGAAEAWLDFVVRCGLPCEPPLGVIHLQRRDDIKLAIAYL